MKLSLLFSEVIVHISQNQEFLNLLVILVSHICASFSAWPKVNAEADRFIQTLKTNDIAISEGAPLQEELLKCLSYRNSPCIQWELH